MYHDKINTEAFNMEVLFLAIIFLFIILAMAKGRQLYEAVFFSLILIIIFYRFSIFDAATYVLTASTSWSTLSILLAFYFIAFLQRILESRRQLELAQKDLDGIFHNRRINTAGASIFIGFLPAAAAMGLCSQIVKDATDGYLTKKEQAFVTSWIRHIPESIVPTYSGILLILGISGIETASYVVGMLIPVIFLMLIGYFAGLNKIPKDPGTFESNNKFADFINLLKHLWSLILIVSLIFIFKMDVCWSVLIAIIGCIFVYRFSWNEIKPFFKSAFEARLILITYSVLVLKEFIAHTGALEVLPKMIQKLPLPAYLIFAILFFVITAISGSTSAIAIGAPLAFAALPANTAFVVYLMCMIHAASQMGLTHTCVMVAAEYYGITFGELIRKTIPYSLLFCVIATIYYNLWIMFI